jgi:serine/threonine-protein kinase
MEYLEGETVGAYLHRHTKLVGEPEVARAIVREIADALSAAHARTIIHRDLKPDNVFLASAGAGAPHLARVKILDFGIAKLAGAGNTPSITHTGSLLGTPVYASPEQFKGAKTLDHRTDIYSLGCIAFELMTGRPPFVGESVGELVASHLYAEPPALRTLEPTTSPAFEALVQRMLAKAAEDRPQSMREVVAAIDADGVPQVLRGGSLVLPPALALLFTPTGESATSHLPPPADTASGNPDRPPDDRASAQPMQRQTGESTLSQLASETVPATEPATAPPPWKVMAVVGSVVAVGALSWFAMRSPAPRTSAPTTKAAAASPAPPQKAKLSASVETVVEVQVEDPPPGLEVFVDGTKAALPVILPRDAKVHTFAFQAPGYQPLTRQLDASKSRTLLLGMRPVQPVAPPPPPASPSGNPKPGKRKPTTDLFLDL